MFISTFHFLEACRTLGASPSLMQGKSRLQDTVRDRCHIMRTLFIGGYSYTSIAHMTRRHHSTVMYHIKGKCTCREEGRRFLLAQPRGGDLTSRSIRRSKHAATKGK